jgi:phosphate:Na+ symporter
MFLFGMQWLSASLRTVAGDRLRRWLTAATDSQVRGLGLGTAVGFLAHSSAASVMTIGFINAGLISLAASLPLLFGANLGTTLSMQLVSLRLTDYALAAIAIGGIVFLTAKEGRARLIGKALLGFGFLFLGMKISGEAIVPYRDELAPVLARIDGGTWSGLFFGIVVSAAITGLVQSSGAVIGMSFVLAGSGVFGSLNQTYPIVLGAHIGTCVTGLLAAIGALPDGRRAALANLFFNVFNATVGALAAPILIPLLEKSSPDLIHQTANTHTAIMAIAVLLVAPFSGPAARVMRRIVRSNEPEPQGSFLESQLLTKPEDALLATIRELGRCASLCDSSFVAVTATLGDGSSKRLRVLTRNELSINEIKTSVRTFVASLATNRLSRRQALLVRSLNRCATELERIGDHIQKIGDLVRDGKGKPLEWMTTEVRGNILSLTGLSGEVVRRVASSFEKADSDSETVSWNVLDARNKYIRDSAGLVNAITRNLSRAGTPARAALGFSEFSVALDRIVRHCGVIAREQRHEFFAIKASKLGQGPVDVSD